CSPSDIASDTSNLLYKYDASDDSWSTIGAIKPTMLVAELSRVAAPEAASLGSRIYVLGGTAQRGVLEAYDVITNSWSTHAALLDRLGGRAVAGPDDRIYVVGGTVTQGATDLVSAFTPSANRWVPVAPLRARRTAHAVVQGPDGRLYAFGGNSGVGTLD